VVAWATDALDQVRRDVWNNSRGGKGRATARSKGIKNVRWVLCRNPEDLSEAQAEATARTAPPYKGNGRRPPLIYRQKAPSIKELALAAGRDQTRVVAWRQGSRRRGGTPVKMRSHFLFLRVRPASKVHRRAVAFGDLPVQWLIAQWPPGQPEPTRYWLSNLPADTAYRTLVRSAKLRWRIEHDYRELKTELGLDHFEGRTWQGWHHHVTLVCAAHAFLTLQRLDPKAPAPA
jgi:SRSO17 transposase